MWKGDDYSSDYGGFQFFLRIVPDKWHKTSLQSILYKKKNFGEFIRDKTEILFLPKRNPYYTIDQIAYIFMKRLRQQYKDVLMMDEESRDNIFQWELEQIEEEKKENK